MNYYCWPQHLCMICISAICQVHHTLRRAWHRDRWIAMYSFKHNNENEKLQHCQWIISCILINVVVLTMLTRRSVEHSFLEKIKLRWLLAVVPLPLPDVSRKINCRGTDNRDSTEQEVRVGSGESRIIVGSLLLTLFVDILAGSRTGCFGLCWAP